jgi:5-methylcytosine-specific restriction protein A
VKKPKIFKPNRKKGKTFSLKKNQARQKGYDSEWEKFRYRFLHYNPQCYACGATKETSGRGLHVDHITPHRGDRDLFWKKDNLIPLCQSCHSIVTQKFDRAEIPLTLEKLTWLAEQRKKNNVTCKVKIVPTKINRML